MSGITTEDCRQFIADWVKLNSVLIQPYIDQYGVKLRNQHISTKGKSHIGDGTAPTDWVRRRKVKVGNTTIRLFTGNVLHYRSELCFCVHEQNGTLVQLEQTEYEDAVAKYNVKY